MPPPTRPLPARFLAAALLVVALLLAEPARAQWPVTVTDLAGRSVTVPREPHAVLLGEGLQLVALSLLLPDPVAPLAGWAGDLRRVEPALFEQFRIRFPALAALPSVGTSSADGFSLEAALAVRPDLAILSAWQVASEPGQLNMRRLTEAGVPVVVVDFFLEPLRDTAASMRLLGRVFGREERGNGFAEFHQSRLDAVRVRVASSPAPSPTVLLHAFPGVMTCCWAAGSTGIGEFLRFVGGRNVAAASFPGGIGGQLNLEQVILGDPDVYVATGLPGRTAPGSLFLGPGVAPAVARRSLGGVLREPGLSSLGATRRGRAHGLWNFLNGVPLNLLAVEALARWVRPDLFGDLDPGVTLRAINDRFAAVPFTGAYWVSLDPTADGTPVPPPAFPRGAPP